MSIFQIISDLTQTRVKESNKSIVDSAVAELAAPEISRRKKLILKGYERLEKANEELAKIKPQVMSVSLEGVENKAYSKSDFDKKNQLEKEIEGITDGLTKALDEKTPDYSVLSKFVKVDKE